MLEHAGVRYELLERLGGGPSGDVHVAQAVTRDFERRVCVKLLAGTLEPEHAGALRQEARLLAQVRHANVVSLLALGEDARAGPFLVLELVEGLDLSALSGALARGGQLGQAGPIACGDGARERLADGVAVHVACALLRALGAVQRSLPGMVHRDVTPHNVLVSAHGEVKLGDFGIALARERTCWTRPTSVKGKLGYMSPEQILGEDLDVRSDLFAVGVVLYQLLAGQRPWGRIRSALDLGRVVEEPATPLRAYRPRLDPRLLAAVDRFLERAPERRFADADDALRALAPFGAGELGSLRLGSLVTLVRSSSMS